MDREKYLELSARIVAVEYLVKRTIWTLASTQIADKTGQIDAVDVLRQDAISSLRRATFPSLDPAASDHVAALAEESLDRILTELLAEMEAE